MFFMFFMFYVFYVLCFLCFMFFMFCGLLTSTKEYHDPNTRPRHHPAPALDPDLDPP